MANLKNICLGDRVRITLEGTVDAIQSEGRGVIGVTLAGIPHRFLGDTLAQVQRTNFKEGDQVTDQGGGLVRTILAVHDCYAWLDDGGQRGGGPQTVNVATIRHANC